jgi:ribonuclease P protein component
VAKHFTLGKEERLKSRKQTEQLFSEGKKFTVGQVRVFYLFSKIEKASLRPALIGFGTGASTKNFKKAVDRNRIKRLVREAYRLQKKDLREKLKEKNAQLNVFFIYTGRELPVYKEVYEMTGKCLDKLGLLLNEIN